MAPQRQPAGGLQRRGGRLAEGPAGPGRVRGQRPGVGRPGTDLGAAPLLRHRRDAGSGPHPRRRPRRPRRGGQRHGAGRPRPRRGRQPAQPGARHPAAERRQLRRRHRAGHRARRARGQRGRLLRPPGGPHGGARRAHRQRAPHLPADRAGARVRRPRPGAAGGARRLRVGLPAPGAAVGPDRHLRADRRRGGVARRRRAGLVAGEPAVRRRLRPGRPVAGPGLRADAGAGAAGDQAGDLRSHLLPARRRAAAGSVGGAQLLADGRRAGGDRRRAGAWGGNWPDGWCTAPPG